MTNVQPSRAEPSRAELRRTLSRVVQAMIDVLDLLDGDPDLEPDEPDLEHDGREPFGCDLLGRG